MRHVVCFSGGIESALVAIEVVRRFGKDDVILLNHNICQAAEDHDIKQYKQTIANYLELPITFCNAPAESDRELDPLWKCIRAKAFKVGRGTELCTNRLKTAPFHAWLDQQTDELIIYYGFTSREPDRISRRQQILSKRGIASDYPLLWSKRTINDTTEIGIPRPNHYNTWQHGNCIGCLKAGWQHWYCVYVLRRDRWELAKYAESKIGYTINQRGGSPCRLIDREEEFEQLRLAGLPATELIPFQKFWSMARRLQTRASHHPRTPIAHTAEFR